VQLKHNKQKSEAIRKLLTQPPQYGDLGLLGEDELASELGADL
jgi:hypothetical protein